MTDDIIINDRGKFSITTVIYCTRYLALLQPHILIITKRSDYV